MWPSLSGVHCRALVVPVNLLSGNEAYLSVVVAAVWTPAVALVGSAQTMAARSAQ